MSEVFDFIIIGGGLGGLSTGLILAKNNYKVLILEKNNQSGGTLQSFKRGCCIFDTGMHYLGSLDKGQVLYKIFKYFNIYDKLDLIKMDENAFDIFNIAGTEYYYGMGYENFKKQLLKSFPNEEDAINKYIKKIREVSDSYDLYNMRYPVTMDLDSLEALSDNLYDFLQEITSNNLLIQVLSGLNSLYAGTPENTSLYIHSLINNYYIQSAYRVKGGGSKISEAFEGELIKNNAKILLRQKVVKFNYNEKGEITSVKTNRDEVFYAKNFISNLHPESTFKIAGEERFRKVYIKRIKNLENSMSIFAVHVQLKEKSFPSLNANYHYYSKENVWGVSYYNKDAWPEGYMLYTSSENDNDKFSSCISIFTYMDFDEVKKWENTYVEKRGDEYKKWKKKKAEHLLDFVSIKFPEIKGNVKKMYISTPLTYRDYTASKNGSMYGIIRDSRNPIKSQIMPQTRIPNLYLTGQNLNLHGMLGVLMTSFVTAGEFIDLNKLVKDVNSHYSYN